MTITPDTKDWTWVLQRPCPECGYDASSTAPGAVAAAVRDAARSWEQVLTGQEEQLTARAGPGRWSTVEYACHARDVWTVFGERVRLMTTTEAPRFANWDQDATAVEQDYAHQRPGDVVGPLVTGADRLADQLDALGPEQWERTGRRSDGATFTVGTLAVYLLHDVVHHLWDVGAGPRPTG